MPHLGRQSDSCCPKTPAKILECSSIRIPGAWDGTSWSLGLVIPAATLVAALALEFLMRQGALHAVATVTLAAGCAYLAATVGLAKSISEPLPATETLAATRGEQGDLPPEGMRSPLRLAPGRLPAPSASHSV
jgi:hypothetical protein